jgi:hypothetical protein
LGIENGYVGIFKNGTNPIFSTMFFQDFDTFNLYENYNEINSRIENIDNVLIHKINLFFNQDYNELIAFELMDNFQNSHLSIILVEDELIIYRNKSSEEFSKTVKNTLLHVKNMKNITLQ